MGHWPLFSIALNYHEKLDLQSMARQPGTSEDRPCVVLFSALMLVCPAQLPPPKPASSCPPAFLPLDWAWPGQISLSAQWVLSKSSWYPFLLVVFGLGLPYSAPAGVPTLVLRTAFRISGLCPPRWPWTFSWKSASLQRTRPSRDTVKSQPLSTHKDFLLPPSVGGLPVLHDEGRVRQWFLPEQRKLVQEPPLGLLKQRWGNSF